MRFIQSIAEGNLFVYLKRFVICDKFICYIGISQQQRRETFFSHNIDLKNVLSLRSALNASTMCKSLQYKCDVKEWPPSSDA